jgi:serine-type D-Ala-D-Ala carboxypeptidase (penicillin-binding protein 5/6)
MLQPVQRHGRRRRRRVIWPWLAATAAIAAGAGTLGFYAGAHRTTAPEPAAAAPAAAAAATPKPSNTVLFGQRSRSRPVRRAPLVAGPPLLRHRFSPPLSAAAAILVDARTGRVLWARHARERRPVASTTKIMTALLALRRLAPHDLVTVDRTVPRVPLVRDGLRAGERVEAWKLFYGMLLYSGNDDALALAIAAAGSRSSFVHAMNAEARRLGLRASHFRSPSGIQDVDNYSSAWDLAALTRVALRNSRFRAIVRTRRRLVPWSPPTYAKVYVNKNLLLGTYRGATGVKTGYTTKAGRCLVASATRGRTSLIAVVLDAPDQYRDARRLLDLGFRALGA